MSVRRSVISIAALILLCGSEPACINGQAHAAPPMADIMNDCEHMTTGFDKYVQCIKDIYNGEGARPDAPEVRWFYFQLGELSERYLKKEITQSKAMSEAYRAYLDATGSQNRRRQW